MSMAHIDNDINLPTECVRCHCRKTTKYVEYLMQAQSLHQS